MDNCHLREYVEYLELQYPEVLIGEDPVSPRPSPDIHRFRAVYTHGERTGELPPFSEWLEKREPKG